MGGVVSREFETWRAHARRMVSAGHRPDCPGRAIGPPNGWDEFEGVYPPCPGCVTPRDRVLWSQLADEADSHARRGALVSA